MARNQIKGLTVEIGGDTTKLGKALESVNKQSGDLSKELGEINRQLKFDPENTELLAQKQKVLEDAIGATASKLETLREAERQVQKQFERGEVSEEQVRALRREIIATEGKLDSYRQAARETADAVENLGTQTEDTTETMAGALATGLTGAAAGITAIATAATAAAESTREYRADMGKLETAYTTAGHTQEAAKKTYEDLQMVLGDSAQAVEAANHLAQLADTEQELATWTEIATGVYASFGDSLPIENLTEAANETAKTGAITGGLADALNWANTQGMDFGISLKKNIDFTKLSAEELKNLTDSEKREYEARKAQYEEIEKYNEALSAATSAEDKFQFALDNCATEQERQQLITSTLNTIFGEASETYKEVNADVMEANGANEQWTSSLAEVGAAVEPLLTDVKNMGAELLGRLVPVINVITNNLPIFAVGLGGIAAAMVAFKVASLAATAATQGMTLAQYAAAAAQGVLNAVMNANPIGLIILGITALVVAVMAMVKHWDAFREFFVSMWEGIKKIFKATVDWLKENWQSLLLFIVNPLAGVFKYCYEHFDGFRASVDKIMGKVKSAVTSFIDSLKKIPGKVKEMADSAYAKLKELPEKALAVGKDLVSGLWQGIQDKFEWLKQKIKSFTNSVLDGIKDFFGVASPSKETEWIGKMLDEGMAVGVTKNADEPIKAMDKLSSEMLASASGEGDLMLERNIQNTFGGGVPSQDTGIHDALNKILQAVERGQVIMLDGKTLVGSTAVRYDNELGQRRVLTERGAL